MRTRVLLICGAIVALAAVGIVAAGFAGESETAELEAAGLTAVVADMRRAERERVARALRRPVLGVDRETLDSIAECESHGDPRAVSSDGTYRGKYQFDRGTWERMGGTGDPAKAPELEQDLRAAALLKASGSSPWPNCG